MTAPFLGRTLLATAVATTALTNAIVDDDRSAPGAWFSWGSNESHGDDDFGLNIERQLNAKSTKLFGTGKPPGASAPGTVGPYRTLTQRAHEQVLVADGLTVEYLTRSAANATDMMAFYPAAHPTHLITCVEGGRELLANGKYNPAVQRIHLQRSPASK